MDYIKIDGSLIRNILTDEKSQSLVISIILFAVESGFQTIAEYIENPDIMERIRSLVCGFRPGGTTSESRDNCPEAARFSLMRFRAVLFFFSVIR